VFELHNTRMGNTSQKP